MSFLNPHIFSATTNITYIEKLSDGTWNILIEFSRDGNLLRSSCNPYMPYRLRTGDTYRVAYGAMPGIHHHLHIKTYHTFNDMDTHPDGPLMALLDAAQNDTGYAFVESVGLRCPNGDYVLFKQRPDNVRAEGWVCPVIT